VLLWPERRRWFRLKTLLPAALLLVAGLSTYGYLPLAAAHGPSVNWGNPQTWKGFLWVITADQYQPFVFGLPPESMPGRLFEWAGLLGDQFGWWGLVVALTGAWWWWPRDRQFILFSLAWMLPLAIYAYFYDTGDSHVYLVPVTMLLALWWGGGACYLLRLVQHLGSVLPVKLQDQTWQRTGLIAIMLLPFVSLVLHWHHVDLSEDWYAHAYAYQALEGMAPDSLVVVRGDRPTFALWYAIYAEEWRTDVSVVSGPLLAFIWYRDHVRLLYPHLALAEPTDVDVTTDDLVRELFARNYADMPIYATDPKESWETWFDFVEMDGPIYRVQPRSRWEQQE
jgi:hypothetical protein